MHVHLNNDTLHLSRAGLVATLALNASADDSWRRLPPQGTGACFYGEDQAVRAALTLAPESDGLLRYRLSFNARYPVRLQLSLAVSNATAPYHVIPAVLYSDNALAHAEPSHLPNLTTIHAGNVSCSHYWEFRADRASHPVSILHFMGGVAAVSIDPYSDCASSDVEDASETFIRNGLFAQLALDSHPDACGVTLGYRNTPRTFVNKDTWSEPTWHSARAAQATGFIFLQPAASRSEVHRVIQRLYSEYHHVPETTISAEEASAALLDAFLNVNWHPDREHFTNMRCVDPEKKHLTAWRTLAEVGWTGGGVIAYPLLAAGHHFNNPTAIERAHYLLDWIARVWNPASGLLWDVCGKHEGRRVDWWWSGYVVKGVHCAYTNGSGLYYLLKCYEFSRRFRNEEHPDWLQTACRALDTIVRLQEPDGNFGYTYSVERPAIADSEGFAGVWFAAALVYAYRITGQSKYLDAACRAARFYHRFVRELNCWGTPMDTWKAVDQEGNLGLVRTAALLHETLGHDEWLEMLRDSAHYEYLWRYSFRARPQCPPLKDSHWNSCGGSVTSTSNPHIHPMGVYISSALAYLAEMTGEAYHWERCEDGLRWGINCVSLYPDVLDYGSRGVLTERFCPSDGLLIESFPDGSPSSVWFSYNGWAAAAVLEGLIEQLLHRRL